MVFSHTGSTDVATQSLGATIGCAAILALASYGLCSLTKQHTPWVYALATILVAILAGVGMRISLHDRVASAAAETTQLTSVDSSMVSATSSAPASPEPASGQTISTLGLPSGYHIVAPAVTIAPHAAEGIPDDLNWSTSVGEAQTGDDWDFVEPAFVAQHPDISYGQNKQIMQENLKRFANPQLSNIKLLEAAYAASREDGRWATTQ